jgi:hypothetical protein
MDTDTRLTAADHGRTWAHQRAREMAAAVNDRKARAMAALGYTHRRSGWMSPAAGEIVWEEEAHRLPDVPRVVAAIAPRAAHQRASHRARPGHRRTLSTRAGPSDDEGSGSSEPPPRRHLTLAPHARCPDCGGVLLWSAGQLVCADRHCPRYGKAAA